MSVFPSFWTHTTASISALKRSKHTGMSRNTQQSIWGSLLSKLATSFGSQVGKELSWTLSWGAEQPLCIVSSPNPCCELSAPSAWLVSLCLSARKAVKGNRKAGVCLTHTKVSCSPLLLALWIHGSWEKFPSWDCSCTSKCKTTCCRGYLSLNKEL